MPTGSTRTSTASRSRFRSAERLAAEEPEIVWWASSHWPTTPAWGGNSPTRVGDSSTTPSWGSTCLAAGAHDRSSSRRHDEIEKSQAGRGAIPTVTFAALVLPRSRGAMELVIREGPLCRTFRDGSDGRVHQDDGRAAAKPCTASRIPPSGWRPGCLTTTTPMASRRYRSRGANSRAWFARPMRPISSQRMLSATPTPLGSILETASRSTHSPTGRRKRWTVRSV
jgi:hypothetical protein